MIVCKHRKIEARTERDGCYWLVCANKRCRKRGRRAHSLRLALCSSLAVRS